MYPNAVAEFVFDQSSAHGAFAKDALNAKDMNVRPGGKQRAMHDTFIPMDNPNPSLCGVRQTMVFEQDLPPCYNLPWETPVHQSFSLNYSLSFRPNSALAED